MNTSGQVSSPISDASMCGFSKMSTFVVLGHTRIHTVMDAP